MKVVRSIGPTTPATFGVFTEKIERYGSDYPFDRKEAFSVGGDSYGHQEFPNAPSWKDKPGLNPLLQHSAPLTYLPLSRSFSPHVSGNATSSKRSRNYSQRESVEGSLSVINRRPPANDETPVFHIAGPGNPNILIAQPLPANVFRRSAPITVHRASRSNLTISPRGSIGSPNPSSPTNNTILNQFPSRNDNAIGDSSNTDTTFADLLKNPMFVIGGLVIGFLLLRR